MIEVGEVNNVGGGCSLFIPLCVFTFGATPYFARDSLGLVRPCGGRHLRIREKSPH